MSVIYAFRSPGSGATYIGKHQCSPEGWPRRGTGCLPDGYRGSGVVVGHFHRRHGAAVQWRILAVVDGGRDAVNAAERRAIRLARGALGRLLVNRTEGGEGVTGDDARRFASDPSVKARVSAAARARWADPEYAAAQAARMREVANRPEVKEKMAARAKAQWADPEWAAAVRARLKLMASNKPKAPPRVPVDRRALALAKWADPAYVAKHKAAMPAAAAKRSATCTARREASAWPPPLHNKE